jgi:UDP-glucose:glycoprotein glucosyltransferase
LISVANAESHDKPAKLKTEVSSDEETPVITPLHSSELSKLGYQAVQLITSSSNPLETLQHLSQDFPSQSSKIASVEVDDDLVDTLRENNRVIPGGENLFWMNGMHIAKQKVEAFNLLSVMRRERGLINSLRKLGLSNDEAIKYLSHEAIAAKVEVSTTNRFDVRDTPEGGNVIIWMNDLEKDTRYRTWPEGVRNVHPFMAFLIIVAATAIPRSTPQYSKERPPYNLRARFVTER